MGLKCAKVKPNAQLDDSGRNEIYRVKQITETLANGGKEECESPMVSSSAVDGENKGKAQINSEDLINTSTTDTQQYNGGKEECESPMVSSSAVDDENKGKAQINSEDLINTSTTDTQQYMDAINLPELPVTDLPVINGGYCDNYHCSSEKPLPSPPL